MDAKSSETKKDPIIIPALVLEYVPRGDLLELINSVGHLPEVIARSYFHQLIDALESLHAAEICHFDIKPDNILIDENFCLKLGDFGFALNVSKTRKYKSAVGTVGYLCPEMIQEKSYDPFQADLFALGVTLFAMVSGYIPFSTARTDDPMYRLIAKKDLLGFGTSTRN